MWYGQIKLTERQFDSDAVDNMLNLIPTVTTLVSDMLQFDFTYIIIWWMAPMVILFGRLALVAYRTRRKREELRRIEEKSSPFTREF